MEVGVLLRIRSKLSSLPAKGVFGNGGRTAGCHTKRTVDEWKGGNKRPTTAIHTMDHHDHFSIRIDKYLMQWISLNWKDSNRDTNFYAAM